MKIAIAVAYYINNDLHLNYALETLDSIKSKDHELIFIATENHANKELPGLDKFIGKFDYITNNDRNNLSMAWNKGIEKGLEMGADYVIVPNLDLIFNEKCIDNLVKFAEAHKEAVLWTASDWGDKDTIHKAEWDDSFDEHPHFSCFMVNKNLFEKVGKFDEQFEPAYNEDNDMHRRILLSDNKALKTATAKFYHYGSRTIKSDAQLESQNHYTHAMNNRRYVAKWGGLPGSEIFKTPYNK